MRTRARDWGQTPGSDPTLLECGAMITRITPDRIIIALAALLVLVFAIATSYGLGKQSVRRECATTGHLFYNEQIYRCERLR